jgi:hypothetical protein
LKNLDGKKFKDASILIVVKTGYNKTLKPTVSLVRHFAVKANPSPRYCGLVPTIGSTSLVALLICIKTTSNV